jgi:PTS system nitrogen regulatory IIA component
MNLVEIITPESICTDLTSSGKLDVLAELGELLSKQAQGAGAEAITKTLVERERLATTGVGGGIAIPHGKLETIKKISAAVGISRTGVPFDALDGEPVKIFVALLAPLASSGDHLRALARISRLLKDPECRARMIEAADAQEIYKIVKEDDGKH